MYNAIKYLFPDIKDDQFLLQDDSDGNGAYIKEWNYPAPQPTVEELAAVVIPVPVPTYAELRAAEYLPMQDYLDGIVKGDTVQVQAYIDACLAVKAKYPKPV